MVGEWNSGLGDDKTGPRVTKTRTCERSFRHPPGLRSHELNPPLFGDRVIGLFDRGDPLCRDEDELLRHSTRQELIRLIFSNQSAVVVPQFIVADRGFEAEYVIRVALGPWSMARLHKVEFSIRETESLRDLPKEFFFLRVDHPVCFGDVEDTFEHVLKHFAVAPEHSDEFVSASFIAGYALLGEIEGAGSALHLCIRYLESLFESADLVLRNDAVGLGHFRAKRDHADGERQRVVGGIILFLVPVLSCATKPRSNLARQREVGSGSSELFPNRHYQRPPLEPKVVD